jgi:hypothetical protein
VHGDATDQTDEELRPHADAVIRKLIGLGWVRLARARQDKVPPGQHNTVTILGRTETLERLSRRVTTAGGVRRRPARPRSWDLNQPEVVLATTDEGDRATASGVLSEAHAKFVKMSDEYGQPAP